MKVSLGLVQMKMKENQDKNLQTALEYVELSAQNGCDIVCLPELFTTKYFPYFSDFKQEWFEQIPGKTSRALSKASRKNNVVLVGGSIWEKSNSRLYNTSMVFSQSGKLLGKYRKIHIPHDQNFYEQYYFSPGNLGFEVFQTKYGKIAPLICYDQWFPEAARACVLKGAEIIFYPTAIGTVKGILQAEGNWQEAWENVMRGHAIANGVVVAACNRVGVEQKSRFWGGSFVCNAFGKTIAKAETHEGVLLSKIDLEHGKSVREGWRFFYNRKPEQYSSLVRKI